MSVPLSGQTDVSGHTDRSGQTDEPLRYSLLGSTLAVAGFQIGRLISRQRLLLAGLGAIFPAAVMMAVRRTAVEGLDRDLAFQRPGRALAQSGFEGYTRSKLANVLFARELARRAAGSGVRAYSLHPGAVATDIFRHLFPAAAPAARGATTRCGREAGSGNWRAADAGPGRPARGATGTSPKALRPQTQPRRALFIRIFSGTTARAMTGLATTAAALGRVRHPSGLFRGPPPARCSGGRLWRTSLIRAVTARAK